MDEVVATFSNDYWDENKAQFKDILDKSGIKASISKEETLEDKNWNEEWERKVSSIKVNDRIGIAPEWKLNELDTPIRIAINPKMSFGTGEHSTTRLMCLLAEKVIKNDTEWIDVGTGTGVLAILAVLLGAGKVLAFDNNYWSIENALENINLNKVESKVIIFESDVENFNFPDCDGIMANLFLNLLLPSFKKFYNCLYARKGDLIVSGILIYHKDEIINAAINAGFELISSITEDEWIAIHFRINE